jgi:hypothetical protein
MIVAIAFATFVLHRSVQASPVSSSTANFASDIAGASFPNSLPNDTYAASNFFGAMRTAGLGSSIACIKKNFDQTSSAPIPNEIACGYATWIFSWTAAGLTLAVFILLFGVAAVIWRCCSCYSTLGYSCCCPSDSGRPSWMSVLMHLAHAIVLLAFFLACTFAYICAADASNSANNLAGIVPAALDGLLAIVNGSESILLGLTPAANSALAATNHRLDGLAAVKSTAAAFRSSMNATVAAIFALEFLVEGCTAYAATCGPAPDTSSWNACAGGRHTVAGGRAAALSSGRLNPACAGPDGTFRGCPCCAGCARAVTLIAGAAARVPSDWAALNKTIAPGEVRSAVTDASAAAGDALRGARDALRGARDTMGPPAEAVRGSATLRAALIPTAWAPLWAIAAAAAAAMALGAAGRDGAAGCLSWGALVVGTPAAGGPLPPAAAGGQRRRRGGHAGCGADPA